MTDIGIDSRQSKNAERVARSLAGRRGAEQRFVLYGRLAVSVGAAFLVLLIVSILFKGYTAFQQTEMLLEVQLDTEVLDKDGTGNAEQLARADYGRLIKQSLRERFPDAEGRRDRRDLYSLISNNAAYSLREKVMADPSLVGSQQRFWFIAGDDVDMLMKGAIPRDVPESDRKVNDKQLGWIDSLSDKGEIRKSFNTRFFTSGDSREPELAGLAGAVVGSFFSLFVCFVLAFPVGVLSAIYLEEFAPKNRFTDLIEINVNNLAAVPSIVFGLLGLAILLNVFNLPRSSPMVGGMVLALMSLPTIVIATRSSIRSVPPSIREAALGLGASRIQAAFHHVVPIAMPGIMTGTIIALAGALGETAPLLMIGMVAFVVDIPSSIVAPATALPVQIFLWADSPERAFQERTSLAIIILLCFLIIMNLIALILRQRYQKRW